MRVKPKVDEKRAAPSDIITPQGLHLYYVTLLPTDVKAAPEPLLPGLNHTSVKDMLFFKFCISASSVLAASSYFSIITGSAGAVGAGTDGNCSVMDLIVITFPVTDIVAPVTSEMARTGAYAVPLCNSYDFLFHDESPDYSFIPSILKRSFTIPLHLKAARTEDIQPAAHFFPHN